MRIVRISQTPQIDAFARGLASALVDAGSIQERFVAEPRLKNTGVGYMKSKGAEEFSKHTGDVFAPRAWLQYVPWSGIEFINQSLCDRGSAQYGPTSDGHRPAKGLWESRQAVVTSLEEALDLCLQCHRLGPFLNFNGNTFAAIARTVIRDILIQIGQPRAQVLESVVGHYVAGTEGRAALVEVLTEIKRNPPAQGK